MLPLILIAIICIILFPLLVPIASVKCRNVMFNDYNRDQWFTCMEKKFHQDRVSEDKKASYAIEVGLASSLELQSVMSSRSVEYSRVSGGKWSWREFRDDISRVSDAAILVRSQDIHPTVEELLATFIDSDSIYTISDEALQQIYNIIPDHYDNTQDIPIPHPHLPNIPLPNLPSREEILRRIKQYLEKIKQDLETSWQDNSSKAKEVLDNIQRFVRVQLEILPEEVRRAIVVFDRYRREHPYIVAGATVVLTIIAVEIIMPWAILGLLRMVGFMETGPVAGSWAALTQSALYGGRTRGLFSIIQSMTMKAKIFWPVKVFTGITAITAGLIVWSPENMKETVETWARTEPGLAVFPDLNLLAEGGSVSLEALEDWMVEFGRKCGEVGMPEVQWFDGAIQFLTLEVGRMVNERGL